MGFDVPNSCLLLPVLGFYLSSGPGILYAEESTVMGPSWDHHETGADPALMKSLASAGLALPFPLRQ